MTQKPHKYLKIQIGGLYLEILIDEHAIENMQYLQELLTFLANRLRQQQTQKNDEEKGASS